MKIPGFSRRIRVFGDNYRAVEVRDEMVPILIMYQNTSAATKDERERIRVAALGDWMAWDENAKKAVRKRDVRSGLLEADAEA